MSSCVEDVGLSFVDQFEDEYSEWSVVDLVREAKLGNRDALDSLFQRYQRQVQVVAFRRLKNWDEALELSQDVFLQAYRCLDQLQEAAAFGGWLRVITQRLAINKLTRRRVPIAIEQETLDLVVSEDIDPTEGVLAQERATQVRRGLDRLGSMDRQTLEAFYVDGQSLLEMSERFAAPIGTIKRRLHVARKRLAEQVEGCL